MSKAAVARRRGSKVSASGALTLNPDTRSININISKLPAPTKLYDADVAGVEHTGRDVRLFFGKHAIPDDGELSSRVEIRYSIEAFYHNFWSHSREFHQALRDYIQSLPRIPARGVEPNKLRSKRDYSEWANFEVMAHTGTEASIDFFHLPIAGLARYKRSGSIAGLEVDPVVRVQLGADELMVLLDRSAGVVELVKEYLPADAREGEVA